MDLCGPFRSRFLRNGSGRYAVSARRLAVVRGRSHRGTARNAHRRASARCRPLCRGRCRRLLQLFGRSVFRSQTFRRPQLPNLQTELSGQDVRILSEIRRQNRRPRPLRSHRAHVRSVCRRNGPDALSAFYGIQPARRRRVGRLVLLCRLSFRRSAFRAAESRTVGRSDRHRFHAAGHRRGDPQYAEGSQRMTALSV